MKTALRILAPAGVAAGLLTLLMVWGDVSPGEVAATLVSLPVQVFLTALGIHFTVYCVRVVRFRALLPTDHRPSFWSMMAVSASHNLASYVLPAKSGEATFVIYLKGLYGVSGVAALASLVVSRLYDFTVLCGALALAALWLTFSEEWTAPRWTGITGAILLASASASFLLLSLRGEKVMGPLRLVLRTLRLDRTSAGRKLFELSQRASEALRTARGGAHALGLLVLTAAIWTGVFFFYAILARGFGLPERIGLIEATFASGLAVISNVLPINAFAGIGTQEAGWVLGFGILGIDRETAFATGLAVHLVQLFNVVSMGLVGHLAMGALARRAAAGLSRRAP